jgi:hypothetical protein
MHYFILLDISDQPALSGAVGGYAKIAENNPDIVPAICKSKGKVPVRNEASITP